jgi:hypothetical protein
MKIEPRTTSYKIYLRLGVRVLSVARTSGRLLPYLKSVYLCLRMCLIVTIAEKSEGKKRGEIKCLTPQK